MLSGRLPAAIVLFLLTLPVLAVGSAAQPAEWVYDDARALLRTRLLQGENAETALDVEDAPGYGFRALVDGASLQFYVDGRLVRGFGDGAHAFDVRLDPGPHTLTWIARGIAKEGRAELEPLGARMVRAPDLVAGTFALDTCAIAPLRFTLRSALPFTDATIQLDGEPLHVTSSTVEEGALVATTLHAVPTRPPSGVALRVVEIDVVSVDGLAWTIPAFPLWQRVEPRFALTTMPWVYDQRPALGLVSDCAPEEVLDVRATMDRVDVSERLVSTGGGWTIPADHVWSYAETHAYAFHLTLSDGSTKTLSGRAREGLAEMTWTLASPRLVASAQRGAAAFTLNDAISAAPDAPLPDAIHDLVLSGPTQIRALYAPDAFRCVLQACLPYGGNAPGFALSAQNAALLVTDAEGERVLPGFGQLAVAARTASR